MTFDAGDGVRTSSIDKEYNTPLVAPRVTWRGHTFTHWQPEVPKKTPAEDTTFTAHWTTNVYTVKFDANGGIGGWSYQMEYGSKITAPKVTRTGYTFIGWNTTVAKTVPDRDLTYIAMWKANS